ncbi:10TM putative phosphate transporter, extracellular tail [Fusarium oxysporum f. sp. vasinfectum]|nr:10TM putative phosphate transporter, extracellular tail [Fusarium oxysporum f. sp. vasinfectum]
MVLQSFSTSAATLLQVGSLISHYIVAPMFDVSPRDKWFRKMKPHSVKWGSVFPVYTNFACIALIYCIISPLISVFAILTFGLIWLAQRYAILNFYRSDHDTGGVLYPRALNQTFTGLYVMELCLTGLFFMAKDEKANAVCTAHAIIMAIALVATVLFQAFLNWRFAPLFRFLPVDLGNDEVTMTGQKKQVKDDLQLQQMVLEDVSNIDERNEVSEDLRTNTNNKLSTEFPTTLEEVPINKREILVNEAFKHYALTVRQPIIWIPRNGLHVSKDEIDQCKQISGSIDMSNDGAYLDDHGRVVCHDKPPDFSEFAYVKL